MANVAITTFNSGELSPKVDCRVDVEKYTGGCKILENFIPLKYGCVERRPGTLFVADITEDAE